MGTTAQGRPFPEQSATPDVPRDIRALAEKCDAQEAALIATLVPKDAVTWTATAVETTLAVGAYREAVKIDIPAVAGGVYLVIATATGWMGGQPAAAQFRLEAGGTNIGETEFFHTSVGAGSWRTATLAGTRVTADAATLTCRLMVQPVAPGTGFLNSARTRITVARVA